MAHYVNGVRMATTDAEIACMFERAKEVFKQSEREKPRTPSIRKSRSL